MQNKWSELEELQLKKLFEERKSYTEIASILGRGRNSVAGKCSSIGLYYGERKIKKAAFLMLTSKEDDFSLKEKQLRRAENGRLAALSSKFKLKKHVDKPEEFLHIHLDKFSSNNLDGNILPDLGQCKYPSGGWNNPVRFCCDQQHIEGKPYCAEHLLVSIEPKHVKVTQQKDKIRCL